MSTSDLGMPPVLDPNAADERSVLLAAPRGYCAGVDRAVITVEKALDLYGAPVYVRKQIVHNKHVVAELEARGAVFVEELDEVPEGATVVFSAHGVSPMVHQAAADIDALASGRLGAQRWIEPADREAIAAASAEVAAISQAQSEAIRRLTDQLAR